MMGRQLRIAQRIRRFAHEYAAFRGTHKVSGAPLRAASPWIKIGQNQMIDAYLVSHPKDRRNAIRAKLRNFLQAEYFVDAALWS